MLHVLVVPGPEESEDPAALALARRACLLLNDTVQHLACPTGHTSSGFVRVLVQRADAFGVKVTDCCCGSLAETVRAHLPRVVDAVLKP